MQFPWMEIGPSPGPQAEGHVCVPLCAPTSAERQALGCAQVCVAEGTNCSLSDWEGALPQMASDEKKSALPHCSAWDNPVAQEGWLPS